MTHDTLFGHLAHRFVSQRENLATEALSYILSRSAVARAAVIQLMASAGAKLPSDLRFRTQATSGDQAIPDLVGEDEEGRQVFIGEAKFWAGFTEAQPVEYIRRLQPGGGGVLAVIAPEARLSLLWHELTRRCERAEVKLSEGKWWGTGMAAAEIIPGRRLVLVSWRALLAAIRSAVDAAGEDRVVADVVQLQGLCESMDSEAFLPLSSEELTGSIGRRILQFNGLINEAYTRLAGQGIADGTGLRPTKGSGWYGRFCRISGFPALLHCSMGMWGTHANTPLWLRVYGPGWKARSRVVARALEPLISRGGQVIEERWGYEIPLELPTGVERDGVLDAVMRQLHEVADLLLPWQASAEAEAEVDAPHADPGSEEEEEIEGDAGRTPV
jgi:hypothetical protein